MGTWTHEDALVICKKIEAIAPTFGCHVALTGGLLYKPGERKDLDVVLYRIRQVLEIDLTGLFDALKMVGISVSDVAPRWCLKGTFEGLPIDFFLPDFGGEYAHESPKSLMEMGK